MLTTEEFIVRAQRVHPDDRYDYSEANYRGYDTPLTIICRVCGHRFSQSPSNHVAGKGCGRCAGNQRRRVEEIIHDFRDVHGGKYEYDPTTIRGNKCRIRATCPDHGTFTVTFRKHRQGAGCPECTGRFQHQAKHHFKRRAREIHGDKYEYGEYVGAGKKMEITCGHHGGFFQTPASHLQGHGCPGCANDRKRMLAKGGYTEGFIMDPSF